MANFYKPLGKEVNAPTTLQTSIDLNGGKVVRAINTHASNAYRLEVVDSTMMAADSATMTLAAGEVMIVPKDPKEKMWAENSAVKFTSIGYPKG